MHRSSETIGAIATALAKAQAALSNPEKTLTATIPARGGERIFRYASLATGLDLVRKCLGQHEIAVMQTTALDQGQIMLTTLLVHASGEWVSSLWPVCPAAEPSAQIKGAALTYARRYALFTLVGIAGEDDLDAPELSQVPEQPRLAQPLPAKANGGRAPSPRRPMLSSDESAALRDRLVQEITASASNEALALWAYRSLPLKNTLTQVDAQAVEAAYLAKLSSDPASQLQSTDDHPAADPGANHGDHEPSQPALPAPPTRAVRRRSKAHLAFVASQPCLVCQASPCDAHHLKVAQPRSLGRKVSDEFTVPLCRKHHRELHRHGNESNWWANMQLAPVPIANELWDISPVNAASPTFGQSTGLNRNEDNEPGS
jgi:hypothetical protein